ncbi:DUF2181 domain-containing protein, partial [Myxococcus llanfairpwllgwyngyllgogerychwyrndrobwllllantysiliogogogochensis]
PEPPPAVGMPTKDEFVAGSKLPTGPDLTGAPTFQPLVAASSTAKPESEYGPSISTNTAKPESEYDPSTSSNIAKPESEYSDPSGVAGDALEVDRAFRAGGASQAAQTLADLTMQHRAEPGYADTLLKTSARTLQDISSELGERANKGKLDDPKKDSHGKYNTTYETLKNLSVVAGQVGPDSLKLLGQTLAASTPDKSDINQLDDKLKELKSENMPGLDKLAGTLVTELEASGKNKAAKALREEHKPLAEVPPGPPPDGNRWVPGTPLALAKNAHATNLRDDFNHAKNGDYNWFEGDIRMELNREGKIEMRHGGNETGDNLTLMEWLNKGKEQGVGLKLDVKDDRVFNNRFLEDVRAAGVPNERLMFNYGFDVMSKHGKATRDMFPGATLAINPPGEGSMDEKIAQMTAAVECGGLTRPVTFVFEYGQHPTKPAQIEALEKLGPISIWRGNTFDGQSKKKAEDELRALNITGMIDLKEGVMSKVRDTVPGLDHLRF